MTREDFLARIRRPLARKTSGRDDWYRIQNKAGEASKLYIYDEIGYWGDTAKGLVDDLKNVTGDTLEVHLNSPGGDIFDGLAIYQALKDHSASVTVHIDGLAASIASVIAMAGDRIVMSPKASMMIHDGWTMAVGNGAELRKTADLLDKQSSIIASVYADRSGIAADTWRAAMVEETWYTAQEALDAGLVDEVEGLKKAEADDPFDLGVFAHAGRDKAPAPVAKVTEPQTSPAVPSVEPKSTEPVLAFAGLGDLLKSALTGRE
ncbi:Clp protease [Streptomyces phage Dagobah]|nr:Clp protease [Streptomyces phage Dagobah]